MKIIYLKAEIYKILYCLINTVTEKWRSMTLSSVKRIVTAVRGAGGQAMGVRYDVIVSH